MAINKNKAIKNNGSYIFGNFGYGLYLLDTPRTINEQLANLALVDGRNVWAERGALVPQYGYISLATIPNPEPIKVVTKASKSNDNFLIATISGVVYLYSATQGLKVYKTTIQNGLTDPEVTRNGQDVIIYDQGIVRLFGGFYETSDEVIIIDNVTIFDFGTYYQFTTSIDNAQYFWNGKHLSLAGQYDFIVNNVSVNSVDSTVTVQVYNNTGGEVTIGETTSIGEKCNSEITLSYVPEETTEETITIIPQKLAISNNRLFVEHSTGEIFYSAIGIIDDFKQVDGAGYFKGFYNDTSKVVDIEEYMSGTIIVKENGFYYLTIGDSVSINKISSVGQVYPSDHVVIGNDIYAYDSNTGALLKACGVNAFGIISEGKRLITSEYLNVQNFNINATKRALTYNAEAGILTLYYGEVLKNGIVYKIDDAVLFPRELDKNIIKYIGFNQGVVAVTETGEILQDFKKGTIIPSLSSIANFEAIGLRDNRMIISNILEVTELNGINYSVTTTNTGYSYQNIVPNYGTLENGEILLPFLYSSKDDLSNSFELTSRWVEQQANMTRIYAPMSGRNGVSISLEFEPNKSFCVNSLRLPDFAQGN